MSGEAKTIDGVVHLPNGGWKFTDEVYNRRWLERVRAKTVPSPHGCTIWRGHRTHNGYGQTTYRGRNVILHRKMYEVVHGIKVARWTYVCHLCDIKTCVNPTHLWLGTPKENMHDRDRKGRQNEARKTHCKRGHPLSGDNLLLRKQGKGKRQDVPRRICRACERYRHQVSA